MIYYDTDGLAPAAAMDTALVQLVDVLVNVLSSRIGSSSTSSTATPGHSDVANKEEVIRNSPAVKFLTRTDFFSLVQYSDVSFTISLVFYLDMLDLTIPWVLSVITVCELLLSYSRMLSNVLLCYYRKLRWLTHLTALSNTWYTKSEKIT